MARTIDDELSNPLIHVTDRNDLWGIYSFRVGDLDTEVTVTLNRSPTCEETRYEMTHVIWTPTQAGPYFQSRVSWDDAPYALHQAITSLTQYYGEATRAGHKPRESWLRVREHAYA